MTPSCRIVVAAHKPYWMPEDPLYLPLQAGSLGKEGFGIARDCVGENISSLNPWRGELTALYWAWRHVDAEYIGLAHYRRHFSISPSPLSLKRRKQALLTAGQLAPLLRESPVILPRQRRYYLDTIGSHFKSIYGEAGLRALWATLEENFSQYLEPGREVLRRRQGHAGNMLIMRRDLLDSYCAWLFAVLDSVESRLLASRSGLPLRLSGFLAERLLDVWITANKIAYHELPVLMLERVNWPGKFAAFLGRKIAGRKS